MPLYDKNRRSLHKDVIYKKQKETRDLPESKKTKRLLYN